jgi:predicted hotdog family 3-hydroxylacyl-ACP dehydratase
MLLLDRVLDARPDQVTCSARVQASCPLVEERGLPSWALPEYIAQAAAVLRGVAADGDPGRPGFLAALPEVSLSDPEHLPVGAELEVTARRQRTAGGGMAMLDGEVCWQGQVICRARLVVKE